MLLSSVFMFLVADKYVKEESLRATPTYYTIATDQW